MFSKSKKEIKIREFKNVSEGLRELYNKKLFPLEQMYKFHELHSPKLDDADFSGTPMIIIIGQYSTGKTTLIKYLLGQDFPGCRIGPEPTTDQFIVIMHGETERSIPGNALVVDPKKPFKAMSKFGNNFLNRFSCSEIKNDLVKGLTIVDTPGILSGEKQSQLRGYPYVDVLRQFAERSDRIYLLFDAHKLDISDEFRSAINVVKEFDTKIRIILNKADAVTHQQLMRVYGALMWSLGKIITTPEVARVYIGSFWDQPLQNDYGRKLFELEEADLMADLAHLPPSCILRMVNDIISRLRLAKTYAYLISDIAKNMPTFFKEKKKAEILENIPELFNRIKVEFSISEGDFPKIDDFKEKLKYLDFSKFPVLKPKMIEEVDNMLNFDLPRIMDMVPKEESFKPDKSTLRGGIFSHMALPTKDDTISTNPFTANADDTIRLGTDPNEWVVERKKHKYDAIFHELELSNGKLRGDMARPILQKSKLPNTALMKVWKLSDIDQDGCLDEDEFALAQYLIDIKLEGTELPQLLPKQLIPPSKRHLLTQGQ